MLFFQKYLYLYLLQLLLYSFQRILIFIHSLILFFSYKVSIIFNYIPHSLQFKNLAINSIIYFYLHEHLQPLIAFTLLFLNIPYMLMIFRFYFFLLFLIQLISQLNNRHLILMQIYHLLSMIIMYDHQQIYDILKEVCNLLHFSNQIQKVEFSNQPYLQLLIFSVVNVRQVLVVIQVLLVFSCVCILQVRQDLTKQLTFL